MAQVSALCCWMTAVTNREEFLRLYPSDKEWGSDEMLTDALIARRCGGTDVLNQHNMKTLYLDYPDAGRRYNIRFDMTGFDANSIRVSTDSDRIVVQAERCDEQGRQHCRKIQKPRGVDHTKFKSYLTADYILIIEAPAPHCSHSHKILKVYVTVVLTVLWLVAYAVSTCLATFTCRFAHVVHLIYGARAWNDHFCGSGCQRSRSPDRSRWLQNQNS